MPGGIGGGGVDYDFAHQGLHCIWLMRIAPYSSVSTHRVPNQVCSESVRRCRRQKQAKMNAEQCNYFFAQLC